MYHNAGRLSHLPHAAELRGRRPNVASEHYTTSGQITSWASGEFDSADARAAAAELVPKYARARVANNGRDSLTLS